MRRPGKMLLAMFVCFLESHWFSAVTLSTCDCEFEYIFHVQLIADIKADAVWE